VEEGSRRVVPFEYGGDDENTDEDAPPREGLGLLGLKDENILYCKVISDKFRNTCVQVQNLQTQNLNLRSNYN